MCARPAIEAMALHMAGKTTTLRRANHIHALAQLEEIDRQFLAFQVTFIGFDPAKRAARLSKAERGHLGLLKADDKHPRRKALEGEVPAVKTLRELRVKADEGYTAGQKLTVALFELGERVDVVGTSKGRGYTGHVKRHGFMGGPRTHGQSDRLRRSGSIGPGTTPGKVHKNKRMAGHMGVERVTTQNLQVVLLDAERNLIGVKGPVPGANGGLVLVTETRKK